MAFKSYYNGASMNRQRNAMPDRRNRNHRAGFTPQQILILILFGVLGSATLILAAYLVLTGNLSSPAASRASGAQVSQAGPTLPPTWTALPANAARPAATSSPAQALPPLPASCAQAGKSFSQGSLTRVIDGGTIAVQAGGRLLRVGYAGIDISEMSGPDQPAAQKVRELIDSQPIVLVQDVSDQDAEGRLLRYVFAGSHFINFELVRQGFATVLPNSPDQACAAFLQQAEQQARADRLGVWTPTPVPTRTFMPFVTLDPNQLGCDCSKKYTCSDFKTHAAAQVCLNACNDYSSKLDEDHNGIACENLP